MLTYDSAEVDVMGPTPACSWRPYHRALTTVACLPVDGSRCALEPEGETDSALDLDMFLRPSRYEFEFTELARLGKGGFGCVIL